MALFSLDKYDVVPIDTHVYQIAQRFMPSLSTLQNGSKTLSLSVYQSIGEFFRQSFGYFLSQHKKQTTNKNKNKNELHVVEKRHSYIEMVIWNREFAGWAHCILFATELNKTNSLVTETKNNKLKNDANHTQKHVKTQNNNQKRKRKEIENDIDSCDVSLEEKENILNETLSTVRTKNKKSKVKNNK